MLKLSNDKILKSITILLTLLLVAKLISLVSWWYLPSEGVELNARKSYKPKYQRVDCKNMLMRIKVVAQKAKKAPTYSISTLALKGLYGSKYSGFIIIAKKTSPITKIISVGEMYAGYKLKEIFIDHVILSKNSKDYVLALNKISKKNTKKSFITKAQSADEGEHTVSKQDIHTYSKNPSQIWKDISIAPYKVSGKIIGFKVGRIRANSKMAELGLKVGDIIIRANNRDLTSFSAAVKLYQNIDSIDTLSLVVLRNNQEKEIIYEIN